MHPFYAVIPLAGMLVIRKLSTAHDLSDKASMFITLLVGITVLIAVYKLIQWLFLVLLATFVDIDEIFAIQNFRAIFSQKIIQVMTVSLAGFGSTTGLYFSRVLEGSSFLPYCLSAIVWYTFALLIVLALEAGEALAQLRGGTLRIVYPR